MMSFRHVIYGGRCKDYGTLLKNGTLNIQKSYSQPSIVSVRSGEIQLPIAQEYHTIWSLTKYRSIYSGRLVLLCVVNNLEFHIFPP